MSIFVADDPELAVLRVDLAWPLTLTSTSDLASIGGIANATAALERRMIARRGSLPHRPQYGNDWDEYLNIPSGSLEEAGVIQARTLQQLQRDPRVANASASVDQQDSGDTYVSAAVTLRNGATVTPSSILAAA